MGPSLGDGRLVLASASPRRADLLAKARIQFEVVMPEGHEESPSPLLDPHELPLEMARAKARSVKARLGKTSSPIMGCDTIVLLDDEVLGKPASSEDAKRMLRALSGRWHEVVTGVCVIAGSTELVESEVTEVQFAPLSEDEIESYVASGEPFDKAGAYGVQGGASLFVKGLRGPLDNVIGLPVRLVRQMLAKIETVVV